MPNEDWSEEHKALGMAIEALEQTEPTIGKWIPCSERLPSDEELGDTGVIATVNGREGNVIYGHAIVPDAWFEDGDWYINGVRLDSAEVIAWQPLPEPYRKGEEK